MKKTTELIPEDDEFFQWLMEPTKESDNRWMEIMKEEPNQKDNILHIKRILMKLRVREQQLSTKEKEDLWKNIKKECFEKRKPGRYTSYVKIAAAIIGFAILTSLGYFSFHKDNQQKEKSIDYYAFMSGFEVDKDMRKVRLILPGKKALVLDDNHADLVYESDNKLSINSRKINLNDFSQTGSNDLQLNLLVVPYGKLFSVILRDGTRMWVNSGTRVVYPAVFADNKREIFVDGEVYLEVAKDVKRPFIVKTENFDVDVLGTSFNIQAYSTDPSQSIVLATGSLRVKNEISQNTFQIKPNQMYMYESAHKGISIKEVDIYDHACWKYGFLHFQSEKLSTVLLRLQRHYNVHLDYNEEKMDKIIVSGKLDLKKGINSVFESISLTAPIQSTVTENSIKIDVK